MPSVNGGFEFNQFFVAPQSAKTNRTLARRDKKLNSFLDIFNGPPYMPFSAHSASLREKSVVLTV
jgi:hypothetical protein